MTRQVARIDDAWADQLYEHKKDAKVGGVRSMIGVPLMRDAHASRGGCMKAPLATHRANNFARGLLGVQRFRIDDKATASGIGFDWQVDAEAGFILDVQDQFVGVLSRESERSTIDG